MYVIYGFLSPDSSPALCPSVHSQGYATLGRPSSLPISKQTYQRSTSNPDLAGLTPTSPDAEVAGFVMGQFSLLLNLLPIISSSIYFIIFLELSYLNSSIHCRLFEVEHTREVTFSANSCYGHVAWSVSDAQQRKIAQMV